MSQRATPGRITIMAGGGVVLIGSFLPFFTVSAGSLSDDRSAWGSGLFPLATYIAVCGLLMGVHAAITSFSGTSLPERVAGFTWNQVHLILGCFAVLLAVGYLLVDKGIADFGIGFWLMLLGAIALLAGAILQTREPAAGSSPGAPPPLA